MTENMSLQHHTLSYIEISVTDFPAAKSFYGGAFGWKFTDYGPGPAYVGIKSPGGGSEAEVGGFSLVEAVASGGPLVLLYSSDLEASAEAILGAGGTIAVPTYDFPGGRRLHFQDPSGNELGVWSDR